MLKAQNNGLTEADIIAFIANDISKEISAPSSATIRKFVEKYDVLVRVEQPSTTVPTNESGVTDDSSIVTSSMTETSEETAVLTPCMTLITQGTSSSLETSYLMDKPVSSETDPAVTSSFGSILSDTEEMTVSSADTQNIMESSSIS